MIRINHTSTKSAKSTKIFRYKTELPFYAGSQAPAWELAKTANLGDKRLNKRLGIVLDDLGRQPRIGIPAACGGWAETLGAYRFFDNEKATFEKVLPPIDAYSGNS